MTPAPSPVRSMPTPGPNGLGSEAFTTGQVARICRTTSRTVCKRFDRGAHVRIK